MWKFASEVAGGSNYIASLLDDSRGSRFAFCVEMQASKHGSLSRLSGWVAVAFLWACAACTSSSSTVTSPSSARCPVELAASPASVDAAGSSGQIAIAVNRECTWDARSESAWITLTPPASGQGEATIAYTAAANSQVASRRGIVVVNDSRLEIVQSAAACRFDLSSPGGGVGATGGGLSVQVAAQATCAWTAVSQAEWVRVDSGREGSGSGAVTLSVSANTGAARQGSVVIAGLSYTVSQAAAVPAGCQFSVTPPAASFGTGGGEGVLQVAASAGNCSWAATSNEPWITVAPAGGSGSGTVRYAVAANPGAARSGTVFIAGTTVTVTQAGAPAAGCEVTAAPAAESFEAAGGDGTVRVTASAGSCAWTAASNAPWISVTSSGGSGSGNLLYSVAANTGAARTGTLTVAGSTVTVSQAAAAPPPACSVTVSPLSESIGAGGGDGTTRVDASSASCAWTAVSNVPWISMAAPGGTGNGNVRHTVAANTGAARTGTLTVAGATVTVTQAAAAPPACTVTVSPLNESFGVAGGDGTSRVDASSASCAWTAVSNVPWITMAAPGGTGNANVRHTVAANTGAARTGTLTVAGATVTVTQAAAPVCTFTVTPPSASFPTAGGDGTIRIDASAGNCAWTAVSGVPWIVVASGGGSGGANLRYTVAPNTGAARTGTVTVAGVMVSVSQAAVPPTGPIELSGEITELGGQCPSLTFTQGGRSVRTNAATTFDIRCDRIRNRRDYIVSGTSQADGSVLVGRIREQ